MAAIDRMLCQAAEHFLYIGTEEIFTDYPLFDKPTSREEFLDAFNVAMQFYEKKDS